MILGLVLIAIWWPIAWLQWRPFSDYYFFPLWLGYILAIDGLVEWRTGTSPWRRSPTTWILLFPLSAVLWWIFEGLNEFLENWYYVHPDGTGRLYYFTTSTLSFATVIPAVIGTIELFASFRIGERIPGLGHWKFGASGLMRFQIAGVVMLILIAIWPTYAFALVWLALFFVLEPINQRLGQPSLWQYARQNNWGPIYNVMLATTFTGFFWELWNVFANPKWFYDVPFVHVLQIFEMPALGYFGYMPFGMEVVAFTALSLWICGHRPQRYMRASMDDPVETSSRD
ncbi:MAG: hypothetical protein EA415_15780 [Sphaerobacteraceae bacterium]|nr:MAG: hypothetical protein EA415_15780 [Sphaerobacteraceae bacterium]